MFSDPLTMKSIDSFCSSVVGFRVEYVTRFLETATFNGIINNVICSKLCVRVNCVIYEKLLSPTLNIISCNNFFLYIFFLYFCPFFFYIIFKIQIFGFISIWALNVQIYSSSLMFSYGFYIQYLKIHIQINPKKTKMTKLLFEDKSTDNECDFSFCFMKFCF